MRFLPAAWLVVAILGACGVARAQTLDHDLRAIEALRNGDKTPLDVVNRRGDELLEKYDQPQDQALIHFTLAHIHAQSALQQPAKVIEHAQAALDSKLLTPQQRGTLYSYLSSAHEVDKEAIKDFAERRRHALAPLLAGLAELQKMNLPAKAPELPAFRLERGEFADPAEAARLRAAAEAARLAREQAQRIGELVFRRNVLKDQVKWLYYRDPPADDELEHLATKALGKDLANELLASAQTERERIEKARQK